MHDFILNAPPGGDSSQCGTQIKIEVYLKLASVQGCCHLNKLCSTIHVLLIHVGKISLLNNCVLMCESESVSVFLPLV